MPITFRVLCDRPGCQVESEPREMEDCDLPDGWSKLTRRGRKYHLCVRCSDRALLPKGTD